MVALLDRVSGKVIVGRHLTKATNFAQYETATLVEAYAFAEKVGFPCHAIVVMAGHDVRRWQKG